MFASTGCFAIRHVDSKSNALPTKPDRGGKPMDNEYPPPITKASSNVPTDTITMFAAINLKEVAA